MPYFYMATIIFSLILPMKIPPILFYGIICPLYLYLFFMFYVYYEAMPFGYIYKHKTIYATPWKEHIAKAFIMAAFVTTGGLIVSIR